MRNAGVLAVSGAVIGLLMLVAYLALILNEGDDSFWEVAPWAGAIAVASGLAATGTATARSRIGAPLMLSAGLMFVLIGIPSIFSIGVPLIVAGILCLVASSLAGAERLPRREGPVRR